jgi:GntR family transcriptional regulator/MocR family aminotransferase
MIVAGSQQGLQIVARALLNRGEKVWIEDPGYFGAHSVFKMMGVEMIPVPVDQDGIDVVHGQARAPTARMAYVTPSHHYPLGVLMSAARRMRLLEWAERQGSWIVEDDYDSEYRYGARPIMSLHGLDHAARVIYLGTFSKVLYPALRIGYIVIPSDLLPVFRAIRTGADIFPPTLLQAALSDFIARGYLLRHIKKMRALYGARRRTLVDQISANLGNEAEIIGIEAGMDLAVLLNSEVNDQVVSRAAARSGLAVMPISKCSIQLNQKPGLILGYSNCNEAEIKRGVELLAEILRRNRP